jgi:large subunit ribosomal protein L5
MLMRKGVFNMSRSRLREYYIKEVVPALMKQFSYDSIMEVPRLLKITINMGVGEAAVDKKVMTHAVSDLEKITGQKPVITLSRKSIAGFKIREGWPIGCKVTLRKDKMFELLDHIVEIALPRVRDFRGITNRSFDGRGNLTFGFKEQLVFPQIEYDKIDAIRGMDVTITTSAKSDQEGFALLKAFNFPFKEKEIG